MFYSYFSGFRNKDVAFLHKPSKSLIEADLLLNLPANEQVCTFFVSLLPVLTVWLVFKIILFGFW